MFFAEQVQATQTGKEIKYRPGMSFKQKALLIPDAEGLQNSQVEPLHIPLLQHARQSLQVWKETVPLLFGQGAASGSC